MRVIGKKMDGPRRNAALCEAVEDVTITAGGYQSDWLAMVRDPNGDVIAYLTAEGWHDNLGHVWPDIIVTED